MFGLLKKKKKGEDNDQNQVTKIDATFNCANLRDTISLNPLHLILPPHPRYCSYMSQTHTVTY